ncbi:hypothetical protein GNI_224030, partial [Gregarina niphandrodes]
FIQLNTAILLCYSSIQDQSTHSLLAILSTHSTINSYVHSFNMSTYGGGTLSDYYPICIYQKTEPNLRRSELVKSRLVRD